MQIADQNSLVHFEGIKWICGAHSFIHFLVEVLATYFKLAIFHCLFSYLIDAMSTDICLG
jgi:hypothetical protein